MLTWGEDGSARVWAASSGDLLRVMRGGGGPIIFARIFPQGDRVVLCNLAGDARIWRTDGTAYDDGASAVALSAKGTRAEVFPAGDRVLTWGAGHSAMVSDAATGAWTAGPLFGASRSTASGLKLREIEPVVGPQMEFAYTIQASPSRDFFTTMHIGLATVWDAASGEPLQVLGDDDEMDWIEDVAHAPGGAALATCGTSLVTLWDPVSGSVMRELEGQAVGPSVPCIGAVGLGDAIDPAGFAVGLAPWQLPESAF